MFPFYSTATTIKEHSFCSFSYIFVGVKKKKKKKNSKKAFLVRAHQSASWKHLRRCEGSFLPSPHLLDVEADRISHISLQHVFHVSLLCESAKHSMHPGRVPGLLGKPDFQLALYATIKIIRPYENTQQTIPLCMFWCEKASAPKFSTRHDLYLGTLQAPPSHCAPIIETPYTDQQIFKFYRYITLRNFLVKQKWHSCLMGTRKILGKQFVWVRQLQLIFHLFFSLNLTCFWRSSSLNTHMVPGLHTISFP